MDYLNTSKTPTDPLDALSTNNAPHYHTSSTSADISVNAHVMHRVGCYRIVI